MTASVRRGNPGGSYGVVIRDGAREIVAKLRNTSPLNEQQTVEDFIQLYTSLRTNRPRLDYEEIHGVPRHSHRKDGFRAPVNK